MKVLAIYGSPRKDGNSSKMMKSALNEFPKDAEIQEVYLTDMNFSGCGACRKCHECGYCVIKDDMQQLYDAMIIADIIIISTSTHFSGICSDVQKMLERTWSMKGKLKNKIGGSIVSGRRYIESSFSSLNSFMLRHKMILGSVAPVGYAQTEMGTIDNDPLAIKDSKKLAERLLELYSIVHKEI